MNDAAFGAAAFDSGSGLAIGTSAPDLLLVGEVQTALPRLTEAQLLDLPAVITSVSQAFEGHCRRKLALTTFDRIYRPGRTRKIRLDTWPVANMMRLRTDLVVPLTVENLDPSTNQVATVQRTTTTLILSRIASGQLHTDNLALASYVTVSDLAAAINQLGGGWQAVLASGLEQTAISELNPDYETVGAREAQAELRTFSRDICRYALNAERGIIELTENRPQEYRYADRAFGLGYGLSWSAAAEPRHAGVRAIYSAGYATQPWDLELGYTPVPAAIKRAAILAIQATLDLTQSPSVKRESAGDYSYDLAEVPAVIPTAALRLLGPYVSKRL